MHPFLPKGMEMRHVLALTDGGAVISGTTLGGVSAYEAIQVNSEGDTIAKLKLQLQRSQGSSSKTRNIY